MIRHSSSLATNTREPPTFLSWLSWPSPLFCRVHGSLVIVYLYKATLKNDCFLSTARDFINADSMGTFFSYFLHFSFFFQEFPYTFYTEEKIYKKYKLTIISVWAPTEQETIFFSWWPEAHLFFFCHYSHLQFLPKREKKDFLCEVVSIKLGPKCAYGLVSRYSILTRMPPPPSSKPSSVSPRSSPFLTPSAVIYHLEPLASLDLLWSPPGPTDKETRGWRREVS